MSFDPVYSALERRQAGALMRAGEMSMLAVAQRCGVAYSTLTRWNRTEGWRPSRTRPSLARRVCRWPAARFAALARVYRVVGVDPADLSEVLGGSRERAEALFAACGLAGPAVLPAADAAYRDVTAKEALSRRLRAHVARQIAAFDKALACDGPGRDSVRVLRDLVGLKRLLDDLDARPAARESDATDMPMDIVAFREEIARRYAAFEAREAEEAERAAERAADDQAGQAADGPLTDL